MSAKHPSRKFTDNLIRRWGFERRYLTGRAPWDTGTPPPELREFIEDPATVPGRAIDLGCGTGTNAVYMARHGWDVVGVDFSILAIWRARCKACRAGVTGVKFIVGDVAHLDSLDNGFSLALDIGCLHGVPQEDRNSYAKGLKRLLAPGGTYLLYAWKPRMSHGRPVGISPDEVSELFGPEMIVIDVRHGEDRAGRPGILTAWYRLERLPT